MRNMETGKHSQRQIVSLIDVPLWNRASWMGAMFYFDPDKAPYPILALGFKDRDAGAQIFKGLAKSIKTIGFALSSFAVSEKIIRRPIGLLLAPILIALKLAARS